MNIRSGEKQAGKTGPAQYFWEIIYSDLAFVPLFNQREIPPEISRNCFLFGRQAFEFLNVDLYVAILTSNEDVFGRRVLYKH